MLAITQSGVEDDNRSDWEIELVDMVGLQFGVIFVMRVFSHLLPGWPIASGHRAWLALVPPHCRSSFSEKTSFDHIKRTYAEHGLSPEHALHPWGLIHSVHMGLTKCLACGVEGIDGFVVTVEVDRSGQSDSGRRTIVGLPDGAYASHSNVLAEPYVTPVQRCAAMIISWSI